jgi:A/G-specific adenine glycosylase
MSAAPFHSPYRVLISEFMLQQTTVAAVLPYFDRWMRALPDVAALADAPQKPSSKISTAKFPPTSNKPAPFLASGPTPPLPSQPSPSTNPFPFSMQTSYE